MSLTEAQELERSTGLGGSDIAAACGLSPWKSRLELYREKRGEALPSVANEEALRWGTLLEPIIRQRYSDVTGHVVRIPTATVRSKTQPWMLAHPDGYVADDKGRAVRGVEIKTSASSDMWGEPGTDEIPAHYLAQVMHYMGVMNIGFFDVAVLFAGQRFAIYTVEFDDLLWNTIAETEASFWRCVETGAEPEPDWQSARVLDVVRQMYPGTSGHTVYATNEDEHYLEVYRDASVRADRYNDLVHNTKAHLLYTMRDAAELKFADGTTLRRKLTKRKAYSVAASEYIDARFIKPEKRGDEPVKKSKKKTQKVTRQGDQR